MSLNTEHEYNDQNGFPLQIGDRVAFTYDRSTHIYIGVIAEFRKSFVILETNTRKKSRNLLKI